MEYLEDYFPQMYEKDPEWRFADRYARVAIGSMMMIAGTEEQGRNLLNVAVSRADETSELLGPWLFGIKARSGLGDRDGALRQLRAYAADPYSPEPWPVRIRNAPEFQQIRSEPEFVEVIAGLEKNAAEQRQILAELLAAD